MAFGEQGSLHGVYAQRHNCAPAQMLLVNSRRIWAERVAHMEMMRNVL